MATAQQLVDLAQILLLDADAVVWTEAQLLRFLNEVQGDLALRAKLFVQEASQAITIPTPDPPEYSLPADLVGVDKIDSANWGPIRLDEVSTIDLDRFDPDWQTKTAVAASAYVRDYRAPKVLRLYPRPTTADTLNYRYFAVPADVVLAQTSGLPGWTHFVLMLGIVALAAFSESDLRDEEKAGHFMQRFEEWVLRLRSWYE